MTTKKQENWDSEENEVSSNWVKFNVPMEDKILGTLVAKRTMKSSIPGKEGEIVNVYDLKADVGSFHQADDKKQPIEPPVSVEAGEIWTVGGKPSIDAQMRNIKIGQKIGFKFLDEQPSKTKGFAPAKNIRVYAPKNDDGTPQMDEAWLEEQDTADKQFEDLGKSK